MDVLPERELAAVLEVGLAPIKVRWGWSALESAEQPPSLPLVTLQRSVASAAGYIDMCAPDGQPVVDTTLQVHVWHPEYEAVRVLNAQVRGLIMATGWILQAEVDDYDGAFRAWRISADYLGGGMAAG